MEKRNVLLNSGEISFAINYCDIDMESPKNTNFQHTHEEYEVYINLSGAVSFVCGDSIYPVSAGNAVINRPGEPHHCVYHKNISHKHYWMLFTCPSDEPLLSVFLNRKIGSGNLITLTEEQSAELMEISARLASEGEHGTLETSYNFARMLMLLNGGKAGKTSSLPSGIQEALTLISKNVASVITVKELAETAHMSLSAFERAFKNHIGITPKQYITQRKLVLATELLSTGCSVSEAFERCGFADYSHFISVFSARFGMTPLNYRKKHYVKKNGAAEGF